MAKTQLMQPAPFFNGYILTIRMRYFLNKFLIFKALYDVNEEKI